jgi:hypothetical protein
MKRFSLVILVLTLFGSCSGKADAERKLEAPEWHHIVPKKNENEKILKAKGLGKFLDSPQVDFCRFSGQLCWDLLQPEAGRGFSKPQVSPGVTKNPGVQTTERRNFGAAHQSNGGLS